MTPQEIAECLEEKFGDDVTGKDLEELDPWVSIAPVAWPKVALFCRDDDKLRFDYLKDVTTVDWLVTDARKQKKLNVDPHLEVLYHLFSFEHKHDFTLKVITERWKDGEEGKLPQIPSVSSVWKIAEWHEREAYDLMGIEFTENPDLRRILCAEDWVGHPLRKDYEMPKEYHGIRCQ